MLHHLTTTAKLLEATTTIHKKVTIKWHQPHNSCPRLQLITDSSTTTLAPSSHRSRRGLLGILLGICIRTSETARLLWVDILAQQERFWHQQKWSAHLFKEAHRSTTAKHHFQSITLLTKHLVWAMTTQALLRAWTQHQTYSHHSALVERSRLQCARSQQIQMKSSRPTV